jgi:hypothetical protein
MKKLRLIIFFCGILLSWMAPCQNNFKQDNLKAEISDSIDVLHYDINLQLVHLSNKNLLGYTDLQITPRVAGVNSFRLWLLDLTIDSVLINNILNTGVTYNDTIMRIIPTVSYSPGDTFSVRVYYHGIPEIDPSTWGGFYFSSDSNFAYNLGVGFQSNPHNFGRVWFPCIDDFVDRATYDCHITTKDNMMAVCDGTLISGIDNGNGTKTWYWKMRDDIPTYLASVAVGKYVPVAGTYNGIAGNVPTYIYVRTSDTTNAKNSFIHLNNILSVYETRFGPYRFERVGYVGVPFNSGAMEHATNIAYPLSVINGTLTYEYLYGHELSHMWFGDLVTCATAGDMWLNEGWASYCESIYMEGIYGRTNYETNIRTLHKNVVQFTHIEDNGYLALYGIPSEYTYASTVYDKGADVIHTLRGYLGDSLFFSVTKKYLTDYAFNHISTADYRDYMSTHTGINLTAFFDAWIFSPGFPQFSIDSFDVSGAGPANVTVYVRQRLDHAPAYANDNILEVTFMNNNWQQFTDTIKFSGMAGSKTFTVPFVPSIALLDKNDKISDAITTYSSVVKATGNKDFLTTYCSLSVQAISDSAYVRIEHNFVAPDPLKTPNPDIDRLSDYRYWKVDGIFPSGFISKAKFRYNKTTSMTTGYLDNTLMPATNSWDSLLLLYRRNTAADWAIIPFIKSGTASSGDLIIDTLKPGEYTLAIGTPVHFGISKDRSNETPGLKSYPNPSDSDFIVEWNASDAAVLKVFNFKGELVDHIQVPSGTNRLLWNPGNNSSGTYVLRLYNSRDVLIGQDKIIYLP